MTLALRLAERGLYTTQPNPRVGCVIVKNQQVIGQGAHLKAGEPHAEVYALREAGLNAKDADAYVTLEPCSHFGRTPPCVNALIEAGVKRVFIAMQDPNPLVAGTGIQRLQEHGIEVKTGLMEKEAIALNPGFISKMTRQMPYVRCKVAASLDGRTALSNGNSQWITGEAARRDVQHWRAQAGAVITGIGTVLTDDPMMNVRLENDSRQPLRVIVDSLLRTPLTSRMIATVKQAPVLIAYATDLQVCKADLNAAGVELVHVPGDNGQVDVAALLKYLASRDINEVLIEAGLNLNGTFLDANLIDEFIFYYAPKLMGSDANGMFAIPALTSMELAFDLQVVDVRQLDQDIRIIAKPVN